MKVKFDENGVRVDIKDNKVIDVDEVNNKKKKRLQDRIASVIDSSSFGVSLLCYILLSLVWFKVSFPSGYSSWVVFVPIILFGSIPGNVYRAIVRKDFNIFPICSIALIVYLFLGTTFDLWHPYWLILLLIPVYYSIFSPISRLLKDKREGKI